MKKSLTLKLIESNDTPTIGELYLCSLDNTIKLCKDYREVMDTDKLIKPIAISNEEIKSHDIVWYDGWGVCKVRFFNEDNTTVFLETAIDNSIGSHVATTQIAVNIDKPKRLEVLPEQFSDNIKQAIVDNKLLDGDTIEVEYDIITLPEQVTEGDWDNVDYEVLKLDSNNHAIITTPNSKVIPNTFKVVSKEELESRRSSAYNYFDASIFGGKSEILPIKPITYSEEEVKELCTKAYYNARAEVLESKAKGKYIDTFDIWFNLNKKK